jgi:5-enolpyruvylshikimate-3-phosphate synthase
MSKRRRAPALESRGDRIASVEALLRAAGREERGRRRRPERRRRDSRPGALAVLPTFRDHRIAMAAALVALARGGCLRRGSRLRVEVVPAFSPRDLGTLLR